MSSLSDVRVRFHYAVASFWLRVRRYESAASAFARVLRIRPDDPGAHYQRAWSLLKVAGRRIEAIASLQNLVKVSPSSSGYYLLACGLQRESRHEEAIEAFREAERLDASPSADLYFNTAISLRELLRLEEAADAYQSAAQLNPSDSDAWAAMGAVLAELGRWKDAAPCQERALRLSPTLEHRVYLGWTLYELKRLDEAERVLRAALSSDPDSIDAKQSLAYVLADQDRYAEAIGLAEEIRALDPHSATANAALAGVLTGARRLDEALAAAEAAVRVAPTDPESHGALGAVYLEMKDGAAALASFDRTVQCLDAGLPRLSSSPWVWSTGGRGAALGLLGRYEEAVAAFEDLLRIDPTYFERWPDLKPHYESALRETGRVQ